MVCFTNTVNAGVAWFGDVIPDDPTTWTYNNKYVYIGKTGYGTLDITNGGAVGNRNGFIGYDSLATGEVTVNGAGSTWTNSMLYVGNFEFLRSI